MSDPRSKKELRERIWKLLEEEGEARFPWPVRGRIPNFNGSHEAARRLLGLKEFKEAEVVKVNPDYPQRTVRKSALAAGKTLLMPTPRLKGGFLFLDPLSIPKNQINKASTIKGAFRYGIEKGLQQLPPVDLIVCGSVAVTLKGDRLGKGGGYSDLEYAILRETDLVEENTPILTSVHELQIIERIPKDDHDFTLDYISTPSRLIPINNPMMRPKGIIWEKLPLEKRKAMPLLERLFQMKTPCHLTSRTE